jgi:hypothetical protein
MINNFDIKILVFCSDEKRERKIKLLKKLKKH